MTGNMLLRTSLGVLSSLLLIGAAGCTDLGGTEELETVGQHQDPLFWWHRHRELVDSGPGYLGSPAWANDGTGAAAVELTYLRRISFPPLQGWWDKKDFSFGLVVQTPGKRATRRILNENLLGQATDLYYMKSAGYLLVRRYLPEQATTDYVRIGLDGRTTAFAAVSWNEPGLGRDVVPSPDGSLLAEVRCQTSREYLTDENVWTNEPVRPIPCDVGFLDAATLQPAGPRVQVQLPDDVPVEPSDSGGVVYYERQTWTPQGTLVVTDWRQAAYEIQPGSASVLAVGVPTCAGPPSTSSRVDAQGRRIGIRRGAIREVASDPNAAQGFGCGAP